MHKLKRAGNSILLFTAFIWGMAFAFQRQAGDLISPFFFTAARMSFAAIEIWLLSAFRSFKSKNEKMAVPEKEACKRDTLKAGLLCGIAMGIGVVLQQYGIDRTSAGKAGFITSLYIVLVPLISSFVLKKKVTGRIWEAVAVALAGMYLLCMSSAEGLSTGDLYVIACTGFFAMQILFTDHYSSKVNTTQVAAIEFTVVAVVSWVLAYIFEQPDLGIIRQVIIPVLYCGLCSAGIGYTLQIVGQKYTDPTSASLCLSFESVFAVMGGALLLGEHMSAKEISGCVIMFIAIVLVQLPAHIFKRRKV